MIDENKIETLLKNVSDPLAVRDILKKSKNLERLSLEETSILLNTVDEKLWEEIFEAASYVKTKIYGNRLVLFAPLYISNLCKNECLYCGFRASNKDVHRQVLTQEEIHNETLALLKTGQKRILLVSGEAYPNGKLDYIIDSIKTVYSVQDGKNNIRRLNVNIAPLTTEEFIKIKEADIGTYQLFQETYHKPSYKKLHTKGPKSDYDYRLQTIDRAFEAGIDDVGIGILFGLYDYKYEILSLVSHIEHLEAKFGMGPHTISIPRLEPATGSDLASNPPYPVDDETFKKIIAILRLTVPYTGLILSTRENPKMRHEAMNLGISQISAGSKTNPGGYSSGKSVEQFSLGDHRSLDEVILDICSKDAIPSFCTSCYRLGRTGLDFMEYAKPGDIRKKCLPNALYTFQEYIDDYATEETKKIGMKMIKKQLLDIPESIRERVITNLNKIKKGARDLYE